MALPMARPTAFATGIYHLNVRVPSDLAAKARGTRVTLPVGDTPTTVKVGDKVIVSLRTKDVATAKARFAEVTAALHRHWDALRSGPRGLTHKQVVALAGEAYRRRTMAFETDPAYEPDALRAKATEREGLVAEWKHGDDDGLGETSDECAAFYAAMQRPYGPQLYAFEHKADITDPYFHVTYECALEDLFGAEADALCAERQLQVDAATRAKLVRQIGEVVRLPGGKLRRRGCLLPLRDGFGVDAVALGETSQVRLTMLHRSTDRRCHSGQARAQALWRPRGEPVP